MNKKELADVVRGAIKLAKEQTKEAGMSQTSVAIIGPVAAALIEGALCDERRGLHLRQLLAENA